jgi:FG-GAP-like repeat
VYAAAVADFDGDGHNDVVVACMFNDWQSPGAASLVLLHNDGRQNFTLKMIADRPIYLATVAAGDLDGDGRPDTVAGSLFLDDLPPGRIGRVTLWLQRK